MKRISIPLTCSAVMNGRSRTVTHKKTNTLAVVFPTYARGFFSQLLHGIEEVSLEKHFYILTVGSARFSGSEDPFETVLGMLKERRVDGLIICKPNFSFDQVKQLRAYGVPFVVPDYPINAPHMDAVIYNNYQGAYDATRHLIIHGYQRIATLTGPLGWKSAAERLRGYRQALQDGGVPANSDLEVEGNWGVEPSATLFIKHFRRRRWPQAVFAANDDMALGLLKYTSTHPDLLVRSTAVIGFDDTEPARAADLTTLRGSIEEWGRRLATLLLERIGNPHLSQAAVRNEMLQVELVIRTSCGCKVVARKSKEKFLRFP